MSKRMNAIATTCLVLASIGLAACASRTDAVPRLELDTTYPTHRDVPHSPSFADLSFGQNRPPRSAPVIVPGNENLLARSHDTVAQGVAQQGEGYVLNFDDTDIHDVLKAVLGDILQVSYTVDPTVQGNITLHTAKSLSIKDVLPSFEDALRVAGIALIQQGATYEVVPLQGAAKRSILAVHGQSGSSAGYHLEIVPLRYASVTEMQRALDPLVVPGTVVQVDTARNIIVLAGTDTELARVNDAIAMFDVDWLKTQSFGLFPLQYSQAKSVATDLEAVIGPQSPMSGLVRILPIDHLNAILVVSPRLAYVNEMRGWIARFDRGHDTGQPKLFVYDVQNGRAADLAAVLSRVLNIRSGAGNDAAAGGQAPGSSPGDSSGLGTAVSAGQGSTPAFNNPLLGGLGSPDGSMKATADDVRITADETNNALLIMATPEKFEVLESALQRLDKVPLQVLLEACVAEVDLTDSLQYGLQYYLHANHFTALRSAIAPASLAADTGGLSLVFTNGNNIQAVLDLIATISKVKVVSAPKVLVLNNRTASIDVGDQVPVATSTAVGVTTANAPIVNTIQMLDTGIILHVTPRVNSGGLVLMDVNQEVSSSVPTTSSSINSPTIQQRKVSSSIAVQDGQTVAIGGLISDTRTRSKSGVPWLMDVPYLGNLFSLTNDSVNRTELIVLITPHVIRDQQGSQAVTDELQRKLPLMHELLGEPTH
jgi:general secretion pathway protein D